MADPILIPGVSPTPPGGPAPAPTVNPMRPAGVTVGNQPTLYDDWRGFLERPDVQQGLLQFGISALQPRAPGQSQLGAVAASIGQGANAAARTQREQYLRAQREFENTLARRRAESREDFNKIIDRRTDVREALGGRRLDIAEEELKLNSDIRQRALGIQGARLSIAQQALDLEKTLGVGRLDLAKKTAEFNKRMRRAEIMLANRAQNLAESKDIESRANNIRAADIAKQEALLEVQKFRLNVAARLDKVDQENWYAVTEPLLEGIAQSASIMGMRDPDAALDFVETATGRFKPPGSPRVEALLGGPTPTTAAPEVDLSSPKRQEQIKQEAARLGMTPEELTTHIKEQLKAKGTE